MTKLRVVAAVGAVAAVLGGASPAASALTVGPLHHQTVKTTVSAAVTGLVARNEVGDIKVVPGSVTRIVAVEQYNFTAPTVTHSLRNGLLRIAASCPSPTGPVNIGLNDCAVDLTVTVPSAVTVDALTDVGDLNIRDLTGAETLRSSDGDIVMQRVVAPVLHVSSETGEVRVLSVKSRSLNLHSSDGDINAALAAAPHDVLASTDTGDVDLTVPSGVYAVDTHSDDGTTRVRGITEHSDAPRKISARTSDGDISVVGR
jgi:hypothetical protein